jgi:hypothetical protein
MRYARIAVLSAAATCLLPFATPAIAELRHPTGCAQCAPIDATAPTQGYAYEGVPIIGPALGMDLPLGATALAPVTSVGGPARANECRVEVWGQTGSYPPRHTTVCP